MIGEKKYNQIRKSIIKKIHWLGVFVFLAVLMYCGYLWYILVYTSQLSDGDKQLYINTKEKEVQFNKSDFDVMLQKLDEKKEKYVTLIENIPDIFKLQK